MPVKLLLNWWNLIYIVPFGVALLYLLVYAATGIVRGGVLRGREGP